MNAEGVLTWAVQTGIAITLLTGFVLLIRRPFAKRFGAGAAYALWALPLIRVFMPTLMVPAIWLPPQTATPFSSASVPPPAQSVYSDGLPNAAIYSAEPINYAAILICVWLGGAVLWFVFQLIQQKRFMNRSLKESEPLSGRAVWAAKRASDQLGFPRMPHIRRSRGEEGPLVAGLIRPVIIVPKDFEDNFTPDQQHFALLHEMGHIQRRDLWAAMACLLFRTVNWPNPLIHYAARKFRADQEAACDAFVLRVTGKSGQDRQLYAETLVQSARRASRLYTPAPIGLTIYHPLKERLMMMKHTPTQTPLSARLGAGMLLLGAALLTAPITFAAPTPGAPPTPQTPEPMADGTTGKKTIKQVIKWNDGGKTEKHYEIISDGGKPKAYSIGTDGSRTEIDPGDIEGQHGHTRIDVLGQHDGDRNIEVIVMGDDSEETMEKRIRVLTEDIKGGQYPHQKHVIVRTDKDGKSNKDVQVFTYSSSDSMAFTFDQDGEPMTETLRAKTMVSAASGLLDEAEGMSGEGISANTRRKIEKARKALKDAEEALAAEK